MRRLRTLRINMMRKVRRRRALRTYMQSMITVRLAQNGSKSGTGTLGDALTRSQSSPARKLCEATGTFGKVWGRQLQVPAVKRTIILMIAQF